MNFRHILLSIILFTGFGAYSVTNGGDSDFEPSPDAQFIPAMIKITEDDIDATIAQLEERGVQVLRRRGDIILTFVPVATQISSLRRTRGVDRIEVRPRYNAPTMDEAKNFYDAVMINQGHDIPQPFDGTGVVVGVCDIGMDTRHPNFLTSDGSECRIRRVVQYREQQGIRDVYSTPEEIYDWRTDSDDDWHATHVVGIAAGAYAANGYQSLAPGADIVFTASQLSDVGLLAGVEDIIDYAREVGKPAVVNLSMGNTTGPHDGTSLFSQYLDRCAEDAIICISAGNDGAGTSTPVAMSYDFTETNKAVSVRPNNWDGLHDYGISETWSSDDSPFIFTFYLHNDVSQNSDIYFEPLDFSDPTLSSWRISADPEDPDYNEVFAEHFYEGYVEVTGGISPLNGRFYASVEMDCKTEEYSPSSSNRWALYWPGVKIEGEPGVHVDINVGGDMFLRQARNSPKPDNSLCISDLATGHNVISVGMTNNRLTEPRIDGTEVMTGNDPGLVNIHSSYGTLTDGRVLPLTCAPGANVVSSISGAFIEKYPDAVASTAAVADFDGEKAYWSGNIGTSMSCPFVVSAIATWLQADPQLTSRQAIDIIAKTNARDYAEPENPRNGQGWFNAYNGLQEVLTAKALVVDAITAETIAVAFNNGELIVNNLGEADSRMSLYSITGLNMVSRSLPAGVTSYNLSSFSPGVYTLVIETTSGHRKIQKLLIP